MAWWIWLCIAVGLILVESFTLDLVAMVGKETLYRMLIPAFALGGVGGGLYGRFS